MNEKKFDVVVIGAGPAGYVAAIRSAQLGMNTAIVDEMVNKAGDHVLGGTCINIGCIPSKALLDSSENYSRVLNKFGAHGIKTKDVSLDVEAMIARKDRIVSQWTSSIAALMKKNKVAWLKGHGRLLPGSKVEIVKEGSGQSEKVQAKNVIIATGSVPRTLPNVAIDQDNIVDSTGALEFTEVPGKIGVIGGGVIGLELGSVWRRLGSNVVVLEVMDTFLDMVDSQVAGEALKEFRSQGLNIKLNARVLGAKSTKKGVSVDYEDDKGKHSIHLDKLVVAIGRKPHTEGLNLNEVDVFVDESGYIHVDDYCSTNIPGIYAVGDVVRGPMLAHKGFEEGVMVAERIAGRKSSVNYDTIPWVIYTWPEIAWVGKTENELKAAARDFKSGVFPLRHNGRAMAMDEPTGLVKVIADAQSDEILGVHIFAANASEMIGEAVVAMEYRASADDLACIVHAHPSVSEAIHEAALAVDGRSWHQ